MRIILDMFIIAVIGLSILVCYNRGFIKSLFSSFGFIAALLIALLLTSPISSFINDMFVYESTYQSVKDTMGEIEEGETSDAFVKQFEENNPKMSALLSNLGYSIGDVLENEDEKTDLTSDEIVTKIATPAAKLLSNMYAFLISIVIAYLAFYVLKKVSKLLSKIPVFNIANKSLGLIYGIILGILRASVISIVISAVYPILAGLFSSDGSVINAVTETYVLNFFVDHNLFVFLLKSIF